LGQKRDKNSKEIFEFFLAGELLNWFKRNLNEYFGHSKIEMWTMIQVFEFELGIWIQKKRIWHPFGHQNWTWLGKRIMHAIQPDKFYVNALSWQILEI
jgi:hypothetical protein